MSRRKKNLRAFLHQTPNPTIEQAWEAAWEGGQKHYHSKGMQQLEAENAALAEWKALLLAHPLGEELERTKQENAKLKESVAWYEVNIENGGGYLGSLKAENAKLKEAVERHERITGFTVSAQQGTRDAAVEIIKEKRELEAKVERLEAELAEIKSEEEIHNTILQAENAKLKGLIGEALSNMEYYSPSLGEMWLVQDSDITAMQAALLEEGE